MGSSLDASSFAMTQSRKEVIIVVMEQKEAASHQLLNFSQLCE